MTEPIEQSSVTRGKLVGHSYWLERKRQGAERLTPQQAFVAQKLGAWFFDIRRPERRLSGDIPTALLVYQDVLTSRIHPELGKYREFEIDVDDQIIIICAHGVSSTLEARHLRELGYHRATDVIDGFDGPAGWKAASMPWVPYQPDKPQVA